MALAPQLAPTDYETLEQVEDRGEREQLYAENTIYSHREPQGVRYTKGTSLDQQKRSWQSLDAVLRSDAHAAAALPRRHLRLSRLFTALTIAAGVLTVAGVAASAREGLDLGNLNGTGGILLGGGLATVGFGITSGIFFGRTKRGYEKAVEIYNDSLGMRLGVLDPAGEYIPPRGTFVDKDGFILLDESQRTLDASPAAAAPAEPSTVVPTTEPSVDVTPGSPEPAAAPPEPEPAISESPANAGASPGAAALRLRFR